MLVWYNLHTSSECLYGDVFGNSVCCWKAVCIQMLKCNICYLFFQIFYFLFFFFAAFIIFMLGYPVQNLRLLFCNFAQVFILPFTEFYSFCPSSFLDNFMKLWSMHYSFFFYFCSFLTLSNNFSLDECLKILLMYLKSLVSFFVALSLLVLVLIDMMLKNLI